MEAILNWGIGVVLALQALGSPALDAVFLGITQLGGEAFLLLLVPLVYWCLDKRWGLRLAYLFLLSALANIWLKAVFNTPRPFQVDARVRLIGPAEVNPGFPSGHAQLATSVWGALAWRVRRRGMWLAAAAIVILVSLSRVYLGVHFPHDVAGGVLIGAIAAAIFLWVEPAVSIRMAALPVAGQAALALILPAALLAVVVNRDSVATASVLAGLSLGSLAERRWARFSVAGSLARRGARFALGVLGLAAIYVGLRLAFGALAGDEETPLWFALRFARYGLVGLWAGGLWPMIAVRAGLAPRAD